MMRRTALVMLTIIASLAGCAPGQAASAPAPTAGPTATRTPYQVKATVRPQEARAGQDENVVVTAQFLKDGKGVSGAVLSVTAAYPSGPQTYTAEISTFPDGKVDLAIPVAPAPKGASVRLEVVMKYQGGEYSTTTGFLVR